MARLQVGHEAKVSVSLTLRKLEGRPPNPGAVFVHLAENTLISGVKFDFVNIPLRLTLL